MDKADCSNFFSGICCNNNLELAQLLINEYGFKPTNKVLLFVHKIVNTYLAEDITLTPMKEWLESIL